LDIHASRFQPLASDSEPKIHDTSGHLSQPELLQCDQVSVSLKTSRDISALGFPTCCKTWPEWVTERRGAWRQRVNAARLTRGSGCSFWPSVVASEVRQGFQDRSRGMKGSQESLTTAVVKDAANWPTPCANDDNKSPEAHLAMKQRMGERDGTNSNRTAITSLQVMCKALHGQAAPASSSSLGSRQGLWPTPKQQEDGRTLEAWQRHAKANKRNGSSGGPPAATLSIQIQQWMTPRACEAQNPPMGVDKRHHGLTHQVTKTWATPKTPTGGPETAKRKQELGRTASGGGDLASQTLEQWGSPRTGIRADTHFSYDRGKHNIEEQAGASMKGGGKLNPRWVETLMGLPIGWTMPSCTSPQTIAPMSCDSLAMESACPPLSVLGEFSLAS
jgi:hypothetical protein